MSEHLNGLPITGQWISSDTDFEHTIREDTLAECVGQVVYMLQHDIVHYFPKKVILRNILQIQLLPCLGGYCDGHEI